MNLLRKALVSFCCCLIYITCSAKSSSNEDINKEYIRIYHITPKHAYQFTPQDIAIIKKLIWSSLNVLGQKSSIAG